MPVGWTNCFTTKLVTWSKCIFLFFRNRYFISEPSLSRVYNREPASFNVSSYLSINGSVISQRFVSGLVTGRWRSRNKTIGHLFDSSPTNFEDVLYKKAPFFQANHQLSSIALTCLLTTYSVVHDASHFFGNRNFVEFMLNFGCWIYFGFVI